MSGIAATGSRMPTAAPGCPGVDDIVTSPSLEGIHGLEGPHGWNGGPSISSSVVRPYTLVRSAHPDGRPRVRGKFIYVRGEKFWVRGVTYGTFRPDPTGAEFHNGERMERDFAEMAANGFNAVRVYTVPPRWLLDAARKQGLWVMVGIPWEQHIAFLHDRKRAHAIEERVRMAVRACAGHPAVLCYAIGNEISGSVVRWHGASRIERFIGRLYETAKVEDPDGLVTYVNYPTTEYLQLPFLDLACFNIYLETQEAFEVYLARLQNLSGDRPLLMAELGLDSRRHGLEKQAQVLGRQIRASFESGCAGAFVFGWTDEWHRGGYDIEEWHFGLTTRDRRPKPALAAVREALTDVPFPKDKPWPRISVVVCSYNGARTIHDCFEGLLRLEYPDFEVIVVNDGSNDRTAAIASDYGFRLISTENQGLASARNTGLQAATGEIVAYVDDDAWPDPHWLTYLAAAFLRTTHVGLGGPNIPPPDDGLLADCVANAPGGPIHVLLSDREAEHIPGCNMAYRKSALDAIGGFDPQFHAAGDDVDVCWRLQERGWTLGFSPAAVVWHHRRNSVRAYWRQQRGYGRAEALLEKKWPEKYNACGHLSWTGRLYGQGLDRRLGWGRGRIYQGTWGSALFQSLYHPAPSLLFSLPLMPEWPLMVFALGALSALGVLWPPLLWWTIPLLGLVAAAPLILAGLSAARASFPGAPRSRAERLKRRVVTGCLYLLQPFARLSGRVQLGLTPWRRHGPSRLAWPRHRTFTLWSECWQWPAERLKGVEAALRRADACVLRNGAYDSWDLEVRGGALGAVRLLLAVEEHGAGRQLFRVRAYPRCSPWGLAFVGLFGALCAGAVLDHAWAAGGVLGATALSFGLRALHECAAAMEAVMQVFEGRWGGPR